LRPYFQADQVYNDEVFYVQSTVTYNDYYRSLRAFPFRGVLWATPRNFIVNQIIRYLDHFSSNHNIWGNEGTSSLYLYRSCVLLVDILPENECGYTLDFAEDNPERNQNHYKNIKKKTLNENPISQITFHIPKIRFGNW
jgi:hypothetical protein